MNKVNKASEKSISGKESPLASSEIKSSSKSTAPVKRVSTKRTKATVKTSPRSSSRGNSTGKTVSTKTALTHPISKTSKKSTLNTAAKKSAKTKSVTQAVKTISKTTKHAVLPKPVPKPKKNKVIRDSFTIPKDEYQTIHDLKARSAKLGHAMKKSELIRAGIKVLSILSDSAFSQAIAQIPMIKTGRPKTD